jgi:hypothetical protein
LHTWHTAWQQVINPIQSNFNMNALAHGLMGGDRRSIGKSNSVVRKVLREPARFAEIIAGLGDDNPLVRMRCRRRPLIEPLARTGSPAVRARARKLLRGLKTATIGPPARRA